jgi:hypothetical protein
MAFIIEMIECNKCSDLYVVIFVNDYHQIDRL